MPRTVAFTISSSVGVAKPASLWAYLMAAVRRPIVEALTLRPASCARKAATVAGEAGSASVVSRIFRSAPGDRQRAVGASPIR
jgi:hypothetical protein